MRPGEDIGIIWVDLLILRGDSLLAKLGVRWPTVEHWPTEHMLHLWDCLKTCKGLQKSGEGRVMVDIYHEATARCFQLFLCDSSRPWWQWSCSSLQWPSQKLRLCTCFTVKAQQFLKKSCKDSVSLINRIKQWSTMSWVANLYVSGMYLWVEWKSQTDTEQRLDRCWFGKVDEILELNFRLDKKSDGPKSKVRYWRDREWTFAGLARWLSDWHQVKWQV